MEEELLGALLPAPEELEFVEACKCLYSSCKSAFSVSNSRIIISNSCLCSASISAIKESGESGTELIRSPLCNFWQYWAIKECSSEKVPFWPKNFLAGSECCWGVTRVEELSSEPERVSTSFNLSTNFSVVSCLDEAVL